MTPDRPDAPQVDAARSLWQSAQLQGPWLEEAIDRARDTDYWQALAPGVSIGKPLNLALQSLPLLDRSIIDETARRFHEEGYLHVPSVFPAAVITPMREAVAALERADWPPVFSWVYDEFWHASRVEPLSALLAAILGPGYRQTPYLWTHVVPGRRGAAGWPPHADNPGDALRITVWIPLSDATVDTGCMSLIPKNVAPPAATGRWYDRPEIPMREVMDLLRHSRPLPARAGAVLAWDTGVVHWGAARLENGDPRVSFAMELLPAASEPLALVASRGTELDAVPAFEDRLRIVARNLVLYQRNEPRAGRYLPLAERLLDRLGGAGF